MENSGKKELLMRSVIHMIAKDGLEKVTIRSVTQNADLNVVYLYRNFKDLEDLIAKTYLRENNKLMKILEQAIDYEINCGGIHTLEQSIENVFHSAWSYMMANFDLVKFLTYYYNSPGFSKYALNNHMEWVDILTEKMCLIIKSKNEAKMLLYTVFTSFYTFAMQVANGLLPNTAKTEALVLSVVLTATGAYYAKK